MSIFSKLISAVRGRDEATPAITTSDTVEPAYAIPTVKFDPEQVTEAVKDDLNKNIKKIREFDQTHFDRIYDAALRSISRGCDAATLFNAIMELNLPDMTKRRASEISRSLNNKATALMNRDREVSLGIKYAIWMYSGAPCQVNPKNPSAKDIRQDAAHRVANGKKYEVGRGILLNGRRTMPGREEGCKCSSWPIIPGLDP